MSILYQANLIPQAVISNGATTGNTVQNPNNLLNTTDSVALFGATSDVVIGNYPFNLPLDAVIVGISGILKARINNNSIPSGSITPVLVDGSSSYPGPAITGLSDVLQEYTFGGAYDIWGNVSWTPAKINNLKLQLIGNSALEVAWATMTVYYYIPVITPVPPPFDLPGCEDCDSNIQSLPFELAEPWITTGPGATKPVFRSFNTAAGEPITLAMLGECGGSINLTTDPEKSREDGGNFIENFNIDSSIAVITNLPNGTVQVDIGDITQRGLGFVTPYGHDAGNISEHAAGSVIIITNNGPFNSKLLKKCAIGTLISAPIITEDEGNTVVVSTEIYNFIGDNVQAEQDAINPRKANITVISSPTNVQPTVETVNTGTNNTTPTPTLTVPLTITSANYLRVGVITEDETISDVTYDGVSMTFIGEQVNPGVNLKVALYGLINPNVGTHDAIVTMASPRIITAIVTGWLDVDTTSPVDGVSAGAIGSDTAPTDSATTSTENTVMQDVVGTTNNPTNFAQTALWSIQGAVTTGIRPGASSSRRVLSPALVTDTYTISVSTGWAILLAGIRGISNPSAAGVQSVTGQYIDNTDPANPVSIVPRNNTAAVDPVVGNDNTQGYRVDSKWFNSISGVLWTCMDASTGAAIWVAIAGSGIVQSIVPGSGINVDNTDPANPIVSTSGGVGTRVVIDTTQVSVGSGVTVDAYIKNIPGGILGTNNAIKYKLLFSGFAMAGGTGITIDIKYGSTVISSVTIDNQGSASFNTEIASLSGIIVADGATNAQKGQADISIGDSAVGTSSPNINHVRSANNSGYGTSSEDSDSNRNLTITVTTQVSASAVLEGIVVEKII